MGRGNRTEAAGDGNQVVGLGAPLTDRVNVEPPILNGMTATEGKVIGGVAFSVWLVCGGLIAALSGVWQMLLPFGVFGPMVTIWIVSKRLASVKRNRPDGYYTQWLRIEAARRGFGRSPFLSHRGAWSIGRRL